MTICSAAILRGAALFARRVCTRNLATQPRAAAVHVQTQPGAAVLHALFTAEGASTPPRKKHAWRGPGLCHMSFEGKAGGCGPPAGDGALAYFAILLEENKR